MSDANPDHRPPADHAPQLPTSSLPGAESLPWWGNIATLWLLAAPVVVLVFSLLQPIAPNDFWYHLRAGWWIDTHRSIPLTNTFSRGVPPETPYLYQSWIAEWLMFRTAATGLSSIILLRAICLAGAIALLVHAGVTRARQLGATHAVAARCAAAGTLLGFLMFSNNVDMRPQTFSVPLFAAWMWLLVQWQERGGPPKIWLAGTFIVSSVLWSNTHGAFPAGLLMLFSCALGEILWQRKWQLSALALLCALAVSLNPAGGAIYGYLYLLGSLPIGRQYIAEWLPPALNEWHGALFLLSPLLWVGSMLLWKRKMGKGSLRMPPSQGGHEQSESPGPARQGASDAPPILDAARNSVRSTYLLGLTPGEWLAGLALFAMGAGAVRAVIWYALWAALAMTAVCAFLATHLGADRSLSNAPRPEALPARQPASPTPALLRMNALLLAALCLAPLPLWPQWKSAIDWPAEFRARFAPTPANAPNGFSGDPPLLLDASTPVEAVEVLQRNPPRGRLFNEMVYGSYLMWALYPVTPPYCDPRIELYPEDFWLHYLQISNGGARSLAWLDQEGFSDLLLDATTQTGLVQTIKADGHWKLVLSKRDARLFRRVKAGEK